MLANVFDLAKQGISRKLATLEYSEGPQRARLEHYGDERMRPIVKDCCLTTNQEGVKLRTIRRHPRWYFVLAFPPLGIASLPSSPASRAGSPAPTCPGPILEQMSSHKEGLKAKKYGKFYTSD